MRSEADTGRLEAFSDGVFAITLLIIEVGVNEEGGSLAQRLAEQWPSYAAFVVSFTMIGIMWIIALSYLLPGEWVNRLLMQELRASEAEGSAEETDPHG